MLVVGYILMFDPVAQSHAVVAGLLVHLKTPQLLAHLTLPLNRAIKEETNLTHQEIEITLIIHKG